MEQSRSESATTTSAPPDGSVLITSSPQKKLNSKKVFWDWLPKNAFQLVSAVVLFQMFIVLLVLSGCFAVALTGRVFEDGRCNGENAGDLMSFIAAQSFALLAAEATTRKG